MHRLWFEKYAPLAVGVVASGLAYRYGGWFFTTAEIYKWHLDQLYVSVFNISAPASAFLFAFYTYVRTAEGAILREIRASAIFRRACKYMVRAIMLSSALALLTVPLVIVVPEPHDAGDFWYFIVAIWAGLSAYVGAAVVRSAYHFVAIMEAAFGDRLR
jgi:hypothetical protein